MGDGVVPVRDIDSLGYLGLGLGRGRLSVVILSGFMVFLYVFGFWFVSGCFAFFFWILIGDG
jgi:hypothetical protein